MQADSAASEHCLVPCFVCGKKLESVHESAMQPYGGVMCTVVGRRDELA